MVVTWLIAVFSLLNFNSPARDFSIYWIYQRTSFFLLFPYYCLIFNVIVFTSYVYYFLPYILLWVYFVLLFYLLGKTLLFLPVTSFVSIASILVLKFPSAFLHSETMCCIFILIRVYAFFFNFLWGLFDSCIF